jgi:hypothetical protein
MEQAIFLQRFMDVWYGYTEASQVDVFCLEEREQGYSSNLERPTATLLDLS